jgi:hypothetical protein
VRQQNLRPQPIRKANSINEKAQHNTAVQQKLPRSSPRRRLISTDLSALYNAADLER